MFNVKLELSMLNVKLELIGKAKVRTENAQSMLNVKSEDAIIIIISNYFQGVN